MSSPRRSSRPPGRGDVEQVRDRRGEARGGVPRPVVEALTVAMVVAPGVYARNRMFDFFSSAGAKRARARAGVVRGILPQLARATSVTVTSDTRGGEPVFVLRYVLVAVSLTRVVDLSAAELAALRLVAERAGIHCLPPGPGDKELVAHTLACLLEGGVALEVSRLAREIVAPHE